MRNLHEEFLEKLFWFRKHHAKPPWCLKKTKDKDFPVRILKIDEFSKLRKTRIRSALKFKLREVSTVKRKSAPSLIRSQLLPITSIQSQSLVGPFVGKKDGRLLGE